MKKTFIGLFAGSLLTGVLAVSAPAATASAPVLTAAVTKAAAGPYTGTVPTQSTAKAPGIVRRYKKIKVKVKVAAASSEVPRGKVIIQAVNRKTGKIVQRVSFRYDADRSRYNLGKLPKGNYKIIVTFRPFKGSIYRKSKAFSYTRVV